MEYNGGGGSSAGGSSSSSSPTVGKDDSWTRQGLFRFTFTIQTLDRSVSLGTKDAHDHAFSHKTSNWGWAQFAKRDTVYFSNTAVKNADAFLITVTIQASPQKPKIDKPFGVNVPSALIRAMGSLLDDPEHSDVVFVVKPSHSVKTRHNDPGSGADSAAHRLNSLSKPPTRHIYAIKKILTARSEYFSDLLDGGFVEGELSDGEDWSHDDSLPSHDAATNNPTTISLSRTSSDSSRSSSTSAAEPSSSKGRSRRHKRDTRLTRDRQERSVDLSSDDDDALYEHEPLLDDSDAEVDIPPLRDFDEFSASDDYHSPPPAHASTLSQPDEHPPGEVAKTLARSDEDRSSSAFVGYAAAEANGAGSKHQIQPPSTPKAKRDIRTLGGSVPAQTRDAEKPDRRKRRKVTVSDSSYVTYKALLFFLYTDTIEFAPLTSSFLDHNSLAAASNSGSSALHQAAFGSGPSSSLGGSRFETTSGQSFSREMLKAHQLRQQVIDVYRAQFPNRPSPCSAKAMYRLADKLQIHNLKKRAKEHIAKSLTVQNIVWEAFSSFASHYPEVRQMELSFLLSHWREVKRTRAMKTIFARSHAHPGLAEVWPHLLSQLDYRETPDEQSEDEEDVARGLAASAL